MYHLIMLAPPTSQAHFSKLTIHEESRTSELACLTTPVEQY